jgi:phosphonate transport system ATP-binding protein
MPTSVAVRGLVKEYDGGHRALDGVDLDIAPGSLVALVGRNGSGKSTLLRCLVRLCEPTAGSIRIGDRDVHRADRTQLTAIRRDVGIVFQRHHLIGRMSVFRNVTLGALGRVGARGWSSSWMTATDRAEAMDCLDRVGLADLAARRADTLSGGQQQRVAIARMLMQRPSVVIADEPVASLDPAAGLAVMELLRDVARERELTTIVALHHLDYALRFTDRVVGLRDGRLHFDRPAVGTMIDALDHLYAVADA